MEEYEVDELVENIEVLATEMKQLEFQFEGLKEDTERMEENQPFMQRQIALNNRKMIKLSNVMIVKANKKKDLDADLGAYQMMKQGEEKAKLDKESAEKVAKTAKSNPRKAKPNIEDTPKE